jgi:hypothetical protein
MQQQAIVIHAKFTLLVWHTLATDLAATPHKRWTSALFLSTDLNQLATFSLLASCLMLFMGADSKPAGAAVGFASNE